MAKGKYSPTERLKLVQIFPHETIVVKGELNTERRQDVTLFNPTPIEIAYKLRITSPETIKCTPGYGYLKPLSQVKLSVCVKPQQLPLTKNDRITFMLCAAPSKKPETAKQFWTSSAVPKEVRKEIRPIRFVTKDTAGSETTITTTITEGALDKSMSE